MYISTKLDCFTEDKKLQSEPIYLIKEDSLDSWLSKQTQFIQKLAKKFNFSEGSSPLIISDSNGNTQKIVCLITEDMFSISNLSKQLATGDYHIEYSDFDDLELYYIGFALGSYNFTNYSPKKVNKNQVKLFLSKEYQKIIPQLEANYLVRDMISTPAQDMGPAEISQIIKQIANQFSAGFDEVVGQELADQGYMGIYSVGKGSHRPPRLVRLNWGDEKNPKISIVGKGVAFDTGGLDIKPAAGMKLMHKDMGGSANAIALAYMIMKHNLPVCLSLVIPTVENAIDAKSYRPSDIIKMKNGTTVEVTNTDAEGRLILAEPLHDESVKNPDLLVDFTTLTGAARVAVGTEIAAFFSNDEDIANQLYKYSEVTQDQVWRLPLAKCYKKKLKSNFADLVNSDLSPFAGSTTAALFLEHFLGETPPKWVHFDIMAWNISHTPGKPVGGEMMGARAMFAMIADKYS